ncbi:MAG: hypothetical protein QXK91_01690 [Nitrososphaerales archaeon]
MYWKVSSKDFREELERIFQEGERKGLQYVDVISGELHRRAGGYPGRNHRMPLCCHVMRSMMQEEDEVLAEPPKGNGATLKIRYRLPRRVRSEDSYSRPLREE